MSAILIVDENDVVLCSKERENLNSNDLYRISALWLTNSKGDVLMAQRAFTKKKSPGRWGPAVAGTVEEGESYDENIVKEIQEELGISIPIGELTKVTKTRVKGGTNDYFAQWYSIVLDLDTRNLLLQKEEVEQVAWFHPAELREKINEHPEDFTSASQLWIELFLK